MSDYKIKSEDKAAFLNRLEKAGIPADSYDVNDNKFEGYFEFTTDNPIADSMVKDILRQSPKINRLKEVLRKIIREEVRTAVQTELGKFNTTLQETAVRPSYKESLKTANKGKRVYSENPLGVHNPIRHIEPNQLESVLFKL